MINIAFKFLDQIWLENVPGDSSTNEKRNCSIGFYGCI